MLSLFWLLPIINTTIALGSLVLLLVTSFFIYDLMWRGGSIVKDRIAPFLWILITGVSLAGVGLSLVYSEIFLFVPCSLCWLQRIALYPQALMALMAYKTKDSVHFPRYGIALSFGGLLVSLYQYVYQMLPAETRDGLMPCLADGSASCADKVIDMFGFVTFPFVSAVTFAFLITLYRYLQLQNK